jgi:pilus assembly protein Flp/PilA
VGLSRQSPLQQQPPTVIPDQGSDHQQRCRILCQAIPILERILNADLPYRSAGTRTGGSEAMKLLSILRTIAADEQGATAVEYGLILAMVFLAMLGAVSAFGNQIIATLNNVSSTSVSAMQG